MMEAFARCNERDRCHRAKTSPASTVPMASATFLRDRFCIMRVSETSRNFWCARALVTLSAKACYS